MDIDIPLALQLSQSDGFFSSPELAWPLVAAGVLLAVLTGMTAWAALSGRMWRALQRSDSRRALAGSLTICLLSAAFLYAGVNSLIGSPVSYFRVAQTEANQVVPKVILFAQLVVAGTALWPPLLALALGLLVGLAQGRQRRQVASGLVRSMIFVAHGIAFWWPRSGSPGTGSDDQNEEYQPEAEYELTLASGEAVEAEEQEYISNILELGETTARDVMRPRPDVIAIDMAWPGARILETVAASTHSRFPVYEGTIDNAVGVLHLRDLLEYLARGESIERLNLKAILKEALFVPESKKADDILRLLQHSKSHLAVVLDEYGGTAGILTIEDLLEEIVGEIQDEHDDESHLYYRREDGSWMIDAQVPVSEVNEIIGASFDLDDVDTLGGLVTHGLGHIPGEGESICVDSSGKVVANGEQAAFRLDVLSTERNRVGQVLVTPQQD